ncbi:hypothetical protein E2986_13822 [Frieseomelitta varia]|uniref:Uncharacterized protein n=1 Tax=Frieseomelitta varia TaxID=561572 RepID=A0A833W0R4_9HYME|nr:hypothetical protein E2986_13822 [Frieseomelitta varia]
MFQFKYASFFLQYACLYATVRWNSLVDQTESSTSIFISTNNVEECKDDFVSLTTVPSANVQLHQFTTMEDRINVKEYIFSIYFEIIAKCRPDVELVNQDQSLHHLPNNTVL